MLHELRVKQIELEMRNEELRRAQEELAVTRARYVDLYDLAPVGYLTVSETGLIVQANLTAATLLGVARTKLINMPFSRFILKDDQDVYNLNCKQLFKTGAAPACELRLAQPGDKACSVRLESTSAQEADGTRVSHVVLSDISARKQAEQALLEREEEYRILFNSAGDAVFVHDEAMRMIAVNPIACKRLGYTHAELMALTIYQIDSDTDVLQEPERLAQLTLHGHHPFEASQRHKDGSLIQVEVHAERITWQGQPAIMSHCRDITERKLVERTLLEWSQILELRVAERTLDLRQSQDRFSQMAEVTVEGIAISSGGILIDGNPQLAELFGYELAEMIGQQVTRFMTRESHNWATWHRRINSGIPYELVGVRKDGSTFPLEAHASLKTVEGRTIRVAALRDLTGVKQQAARLQAQQRELEHAQRFALVTELSTGIIHQLGQPLCAMALNVAAALAGTQACKSKPFDSWEILKDIEAGVTDMRKIMSGLWELANPGQLHRVRSSFNDLVKGVLHLLRQEAECCQSLLVVSLAPGLPAVHVNPVQLSQVILNLVRNAFDAHADCPPERCTVALLTRELPGAGVELSVRDAGTGIATAAMPHLFTPFFTTKTKGLGIGLRICQTIVETHGGRIGGSNNADGIGATFRVVLPAILQ